MSDERDERDAQTKADADPARRRFLAVAGAAGCAAVAAAAVPAAVLVAAPASGGGPGGLRFPLGKLEDLKVGVPKKVVIVGDEVDAWTRAQNRRLGAVWVLRTGEREVRALSVTCPHLGCAIDVVTDDGGKAKSFTCPCHDSSFALSGDAESGPSPRGMDPLPIEIGKNDEVTVVFKRFRIGGATREELG
jgi:Rieske Fe-S protein